MVDTNSSANLPQAHMAYFQSVFTPAPPLGVFKFEPDRIIFTNLQGEVLVDIPYERILAFDITSGTAGLNGRGYRFGITTKDKPARKLGFRQQTIYRAYGISKEEMLAETKIPVDAWIAPFKAKGVKIINHNTALHLITVFGVVGLVAMAVIFFLAQRTQ